MQIPADYPVQPIEPNDPSAIAPATCGHCGLTWDDGKVTSMTPTPSARCPFEAFHDDDEDVTDRHYTQSFALNIELGNDGMQTDEDVARALHRLGSWFQENSTMFEQRSGFLMDDNGNTVGRWQVDDDSKPTPRN